MWEALESYWEQEDLEEDRTVFMKKKLDLRKEKRLVLLGKKSASHEAEDGFNYSGLIKGTSITVLGAAAAIFAIRQCSKKREESDSFERQ